MTDLLELRQQIAEISKSKLLAQRLKQGWPAVLVQLREQRAAYSITAEELTCPVPKARPKAPPAESTRPTRPTKPASLAKGNKPAVASPAKYRGPQG